MAFSHSTGAMASLLKQFTEGNFLAPAKSGREIDRREEDVISFPSVSSDTDHTSAEDSVKEYTHSNHSNGFADRSIFSSAEGLGDLYQRGRSSPATKHPLPVNSPRTPRAYDADQSARNSSANYTSHSDRVNVGYHPTQGGSAAGSRAAGALERGLSPTHHRSGAVHTPRDEHAGMYYESEGRHDGGHDQHRHVGMHQVPSRTTLSHAWALASYSRLQFFSDISSLKSRGSHVRVK